MRVSMNSCVMLCPFTRYHRHVLTQKGGVRGGCISKNIDRQSHTRTSLRVLKLLQFKSGFVRVNLHTKTILNLEGEHP